MTPEQRVCPVCGGYLNIFADDESFEAWIECSTVNCPYNQALIAHTETEDEKVDKFNAKYNTSRIDMYGKLKDHTEPEGDGLTPDVRQDWAISGALKNVTAHTEPEGDSIEDEPYYLTETERNQIAKRLFPDMVEALLEYRNPKKISQYLELPTLIDDSFWEWYETSWREQGDWLDFEPDLNRNWHRVDKEDK